MNAKYNKYRIYTQAKYLGWGQKVTKQDSYFQDKNFGSLRGTASVSPSRMPDYYKEGALAVTSDGSRSFDFHSGVLSMATAMPMGQVPKALHKRQH